MALPHCTIWRMGAVEAPSMKGNHPSTSPLTGSKDAGRSLCTSVSASARAGGGQEPPSAPAPGGGSPLNPKKKQPLGGGRPSLRRRCHCSGQVSALSGQGAEVPALRCLPAAVNKLLLVDPPCFGFTT